MFIFLTITTKTDFVTFIGSYTLIGAYMSAFICSWSSLTISKTQPLDLDHGLSEGTGEV